MASFTSDSSAEPVVWQFSGQGTLTVGVARELYDNEPSFKEAMNICDEVMRHHTTMSVSEILYPDTTGRFSADQSKDFIKETQYGQPILVSLEYALAQVWLSKGFKPWGVMGHSLGEYVASAIAGVISIDECLRLVCIRGRLMQSNPKCRGTMVAVRAKEDQINAAIAATGTKDSASCAAMNGAMSSVVSGSEESVEKVLKHLGGASRKLEMNSAFHSPLIACVMDEFKEAFDTITLKVPSIKLISTVRGVPVTDEITTWQYWHDHAVGTVRYIHALQTAYEQGARAFVEMGPDMTLTNLTKTNAMLFKGGPKPKVLSGLNIIKEADPVASATV